MTNRTLALAAAVLTLLPATAAAATPQVRYRLDVSGTTAEATTSLRTAAGRTTSTTRRIALGRCTGIGRHLPAGSVATGPVAVRWTAVRVACGAQGRLASLTLDLPGVRATALEPGRCFLGALEAGRNARTGAMTLEATAALGSAVCAPQDAS